MPFCINGGGNCVASDLNKIFVIRKAKVQSAACNCNLDSVCYTRVPGWRSNPDGHSLQMTK